MSEPLPPEPDWSKTSFADTIESGIHHALIKFTLAIEDRNREGFVDGKRSYHASTHDIHQKYRRLIRDMVEGKVDPWRWIHEEYEK